MILNAFSLAFRQIRRNFMRAFLTMLGIIIGVGAVIVMISLGNGTTKMITDQISSLGSNVLMITPARFFDPGGGNLSKKFTLKEAEIIKDRVPGLKAVSPIARSSVIVKYFNKNAQTSANGAIADYFIVGNWKMAHGREFTDKEYRAGANVCVLGGTIRNTLFKEESPLGSRIKVGGIVCEVVGVLESKGQSGMGGDQDDVILLPLKTFQRSILPSKLLNNINMIMVSVNDDIDSSQAVTQVTNVLRDLRGIKSGDRDTFEIMDTKEIQKALISTTRMMTLFLGAIAGVSLIVGGIGIMNIMLVSVTERTKEIGTRLAIGALEKEVLLQFLIEAVTISAIGGFIGIIISFFLSMGLASMMKVPFVYDVSIAVIAFIFSAFMGVLFGYLPARRASKLNPIDALRHE